MSDSLHSQIYQLRLKRGTEAELKAAASALLGRQGEPAYTTDLKQMFIHDGTAFQAVQTLDMAVCYADQVTCYNDEIVYTF